MSREGFNGARGSVVVTGGLGFIGGHLVDRFVAEGFSDIRVLDNGHRAVCAAKVWPNEKVSVHCIDIRQPSALKQMMQGCGVLYHLAAQSNVMRSVADPAYTFETNVAGTAHVLEAARQAGVHRLVFASSREVYGDSAIIPTPEDAPLIPKSGYGASKAAAEMYCRAAANDGGPEITILRLANVYGPWDQGRVIPNFIESALRGEPLIVHGGEQVVDFVWVGTVVDALIRVGFGTYVSQAMNIGSGVGTTISALAKKILHLACSKSECLYEPPRAAEVKQFVAAVRVARQLIGLPEVDDPLSHLPDVIAWTRAANDRRAARRVTTS